MKTAKDDRPVFVVGDVHGHLDRFVVLLTKAGFIDSTGRFTNLTNTSQVVQLGDLGHYGKETFEHDLACWQYVNACPWITVLMGNHEMAILDRDTHGFAGQSIPAPQTLRSLAAKAPHFAIATHGYLLTHAGLHPDHCPLLPGQIEDKDAPGVLQNLIERSCSQSGYVPQRDSIARFRGGPAANGGILWRDIREPLAFVPQVFGHSQGHNVRKIDDRSWCIDCAERDGDTLVGIWLPSMRVVAVGSDASFIEAEHNE